MATSSPVVAPAAPLHVPRIIPLVFTLAFLYGTNQVMPDILPWILGLLVLYAALTHGAKAAALVTDFTNGLSGAFPATPQTTPRPIGAGPHGV